MLATPPQKFVATVGAPFVDESLLGYLGRALSVTAVTNLDTMLKLAGATKPNAVALATTLVNPDEIARIATLLGCAPADIASRTYGAGTFEHSGSDTLDFFGTEIRYHFRECKFRQVSPRALEIEQYHRAIWELRPIAFDPQTKEKLLGICPACDHKLGWMRADVPTLCDKCHTDLRDFPQPIFPVDDEEAYGFVTGLVDPNPAKKEAARRLLPDAWSAFSSAALFETAIALASGLALEPGKSEGARGRSQLRRPYELLKPTLLAMAGRAIIGGELGFAALCERHRSGMVRRGRHYGREKELGPLAAINRDAFIDPKIRELLSGLIKLNMQHTSHRYVLRKGPDASNSTRTIEALSEHFGVRRPVLQRLADSGLIPVTRAQCGQSPVHMAVRDVEPLLAQMKDAVSEQKAAAMLGLPVSALQGLADYGLIKRLEGAVRGLIPEYCGYHKSSVKTLIDNIWRSTHPKRGKGRSIAVVARSINNGATHWGAVISAIVSREAEVFHNGAVGRSFRFGLSVGDPPSFVTAVRKHLDVARVKVLPEFIGRSTTAEILQINEVSLSRLVKARPDLFPLRGAGETPYLSSEMRDLAVGIIFVSEFAQRGKLHPRRAVSWLRTNGAFPIVSVNGKRDLGYQRSVVEPLLVQLDKETEQLKLGLHDAADTVRSALLAAVAAGSSIRDAGQKAAVPYREAQRWVATWREHGAVAPRKVGRGSKLDDDENFLRRIVDEQPMIKLIEICEVLEQRGVKTSRGSVRSALDRLGIDLAARRAAEVEARLMGTTSATAQLKSALADAGDTVRVRLIAAVAAGAAISVTAKAMDVPYRMAKRWIEVWRKTGAFALRTYGKASKLDEHEDFLRKLLDDQPNIKLGEIREALAEQGIKTSNTAIWNTLDRFDIGLAGRRPTDSGQPKTSKQKRNPT